MPRLAAGSARIVYASLAGLLAGRFGADLAMAIAVVAAILMHQRDAASRRINLVAAKIVFLRLLGECLEAYTCGPTQRAIRRLAKVSPRRCIVIRDGREIIVSVEDVPAGERVLVRRGKRIPVDNIVVERRAGSFLLDFARLAEIMAADGWNLIAPFCARPLTFDSKRRAEQRHHNNILGAVLCRLRAC